MVEIVIASKNAGKIREIRQIFGDLPVTFQTPPDLPEVEETGSTFAENARLKAVAAARHAGKWALADDSGLEVDALDGAPGVNSARWSGGDDEANNDKLLAALAGRSADERRARYRAVIVVAAPDGTLIAEADGACEGVIGTERKGEGGFGYDPLFIVPELGCTMAELPSEKKNRISHRAQALGRLRESLTATLNGVR